MDREADPLPIRVHARDTTTGVPLAEVLVQLQTTNDSNLNLVAQARTDHEGVAVLNLDPDLWCQQMMVFVADQDGTAVPVTRAMLNGSEDAVIDLVGSNQVDREQFKMLAEHLIATRRVRADDVASDLASPAPDSITRLLTPGTRARLLAEIDRIVDHENNGNTGDAFIFDPHALRDGSVQLLPIRELPNQFDAADRYEFDPDLFIKPGLGWEKFPWALPDDQSYRDYLRSVFVLFIHQQKLGVGADPKTFPSIAERQIETRFFQDFRTADRTETPLNKLLIPIVTSILTAPTGSGFGFGLAAASLPAQGTNTDRQHLDALLNLAPVFIPEFANRYRLPLDEPDSTLSSPIALNIHTLSRALSDTAQGPVEPEENVIAPQLPGEEGKPILWKEVVGAAPFFLRFDEWLARQQPFFAENLFALRTQVAGVARLPGITPGPWLDETRKKFLEYHKGLPLSLGMTGYEGLFSSMDEVRRSATFLFEYGAADAKLTELVQAIDLSQYATAARLADEAERLLAAAVPKPASGENWEPVLGEGNFKRPLSFNRRRRMKVGNINELTGTGGAYPINGFERFFQLDRPIDPWGYSNIHSFRTARDLATRLRIYQQRFLLPMFKATIKSGLGDLVGAVEILGQVTGMHIGIGMLGTPAGMIKHPEAVASVQHVVAGKLRWDAQLGDLPYTARLTYTNTRTLDGPHPLTPQLRGGYDALSAEQPPILHQLEERYARIVQADAILAWAEALYRTDDAATLERARELYKAVLFLHGEDPGTSAYQPFMLDPSPFFGLVENPRVRNQKDRARLALQQLKAGLNFYGYNDAAVPTLRYETLAAAAGRWAGSAKSAQSDYLQYLGRVEQLDLDLLAAKAQERKARATVGIAAEQIEIAQAGVVVAKKLVSDVEKQIAAKKQEIEDANSIFSQFKDYFKGMKESVSSMIDVGKSASEGYTSLSTSGVGEALGLGQSSGAGAAAGSQTVGLGSAMSGLAVVGGFAAFAVVSTTTLQGMADAATKRDGELKTLMNEALPAAQAGVRVQERNVSIARLQAEIAATDLAYARDLINYQNERFLNRDFWDALAGVARRALHRYLDLAAQAAWFAERALAYMLGTPLRIIKLGYFDAKMRDLGGVDRLSLDLAELEAVRLAAARITVPVTRTYSLAQDLPLAFGQLKRTGRCTFTLTDDELAAAHPGTYAHRIRAVDVFIDSPGTAVPVRGMLTNGGFSSFRREPGGKPVPLLRFADAYPVSEFRIRRDFELHGLPGERLLPFEGSGFATSWTLELPKTANATGLNRITDVRITFDVQAAYSAQQVPAPALPTSSSRAVFVSALAIDSTGLATLRKSGVPAKVTLTLDKLVLPAGGVITNLALLLPGVEGGNFDAEIKFATEAPTSFKITDGLAMSNSGTLSDGIPANAQPLNQAVGGSPARSVVVTIDKGTDAARLVKARDVLFWIEYETQ